MLSNWKKRILGGWDMIRFIRLGLAVMVLFESVKNSDMLFAVLGGVVLLQALLNVCCCGVRGCDVYSAPNKTQSLNNSKEDVSFTEIK